MSHILGHDRTSPKMKTIYNNADVYGISHDSDYSRDLMDGRYLNPAAVSTTSADSFQLDPSVALGYLILDVPTLVLIFGIRTHARPYSKRLGRTLIRRPDELLIEGL